MKIKNFLETCKYVKLPLAKIKKIEVLLKFHKGNLFLVGGVVRCLILKKKISSSPDLVTDLPIKLVIKILKKKKVRFSSVGIKYGSIVIYDGQNTFDLTSMRRDVETFGRKANVEFFPDLTEDSKRRDFTINAIYCDTEGNLKDPHGGIKDLTRKNPIVKFIGDTERRIKEDFLRILRFIRFSIYYSNKFYKKDLKICEKFKKKIQFLSFERRINELKKIIILTNFESSFTQRKIDEFLELSLASKFDFNGFISLCRLEREIDNISFERRIKFLIRNRKAKKLIFLSHLNKYSQQRIAGKINNKNFELKNVYYLLYENNKELVIDHIIFATVVKKISKTEFLKLYEEIKKFKKKGFPINGTDLKKVGFREGEKMGEALLQTKKWWIEQNCSPLKKQCIKFAMQLLPTSSRR
ncbi:MAG: hypothetical protein CMM92_01180 [Rickettsiales bacterium]|nr:hypothetical protein [Rickettsiales bacterium]RPG15797.1 MAG: CCA tRNA nucleotidyltransferase [Pelagibacteraceae bacterium TMED195]|tara:strand:- start:8550 stop:9782 length:1233 start_codon:yes stop_codon:yes gene_type:complete